MYTATIVGKNLDKANQRLLLDVQFVDGEKSFTKSYSFASNASVDDVRRTVKTLCDEFAEGDAKTDLIPLGAVDLVDVPPKNDPAKLAWFDLRNKLKACQELIDMGVLKGDEAEVVALRDKAKTDFRFEYINL